MLLYNHKQEFIGIDDEGLKLLNYSSLSELLSVCSDVADLFANEPGYIHNFKNFGWIDFLLHADSDASSAIVHANGRVFSCRLSVSAMHLCENPAQSAYNIEMSNIKTMSGDAYKATPSAPKPIMQPISVPNPVVVEKEPLPLKISTPDEQEPLFIEPELEIAPLPVTEAPNFTKPPEEFKDESFTDSFTPPKVQPEIIKKPIARPMLGNAAYNEKEQECISHHAISKNYIYNPQVAADELGLPVDLIEEFIGDFIQQSHDFKDALFESSAKNDFNNLHILSHKLKGVAANLRIEDAFETLSIINTSTDSVEIDANLKYYFEIIKKLSGESTPEELGQPDIPDMPEVISSKHEIESTEDIYDFGLKQYADEPLIVEPEEITEEDVLPPFKHEIEAEEEFLILENDSSAPQAAQSPENSTDETPTLLEVEIPKLDYNKMLVAASLGIAPEFMDEMIFDYKNDSRIITNQITDAIKSFDTVTWRDCANKLKGISDNLRLTSISEELAILSKTHDAQEAKKASLRLNSFLDQL